MSNRLPETDLANWSFLPAAAKRRALIAFEGPKIIKGSYEPFRKVFPDAINQQFPLFADGLEESGWEAVNRRLRQECKGDEVLINMNLAILTATHLYASAHGIAATGIEVVPLRFPGSLAYSFGLNLLIRYRDRSAVVFLDMRQTNGLSPTGRPFVFSAMHHRFREAYPDFAEVNIEIWRFKKDKDRTLVIENAGEIRHSYEQIMADVAETHQIWQSVRRGDGEARRAAGGGFGPLFD